MKSDKVIRKMIGRIRKNIRKALIMIIQLPNKKKVCKINKYWKRELEDFEEFTGRYKSLYPVKIEKILTKTTGDAKWVGGIEYSSGEGYFIPDSDSEILNYNQNGTELRTFGNLNCGKFSWTGGSIYKGSIYCFPRSSNFLLKISCKDKKVQKIDLRTRYNREHHYGGCIDAAGKIFQPPRDCNHILKIDLNTMHVERVYLSPKFLNIKFRYCGTVLHPNGIIYFLPERGEKVIKLNPCTSKYQYIGERIKELMVFGAVVAVDGNIYGYSLYKGILKIEVETDKVSVLYPNRYFGCYGTKLGVNGKLYGIPGNGAEFWEFDVYNSKLRSCGSYESNDSAKCAGGYTSRNGNVVMTPASGNNICVLHFNLCEEIPEEIYLKYFSECY